MRKSENGRMAEIWHSPSVDIQYKSDQVTESVVQWRVSSKASAIIRAIATGAASAVLLTLDDVLAAFEEVPLRAREAGVWLLIVVPEPHPYFEVVAERRVLVRPEAVPKVLQRLLPEMAAA
ncbi:MAG: hypothetical protein HKN29_12065 [Rhodothermales bacterium]|nr:hypothetical protein [Rhodothermales bacterium]